MHKHMTSKVDLDQPRSLLHLWFIAESGWFKMFIIRPIRFPVMHLQMMTFWLACYLTCYLFGWLATWLATCDTVLCVYLQFVATTSSLLHFPNTIISITPRTNSRGGGRIHVTDDTAATVGAKVQVRAEHVTAVNAKSYDETRWGHRCCLKNWSWSGWWQSIQTTLKLVLTFCLQKRRQTLWSSSTYVIMILCARDFALPWYYPTWQLRRRRLSMERVRKYTRT